MEAERILLRRLDDDSFEEIGVVVDDSAGKLTVRTKTGGIETHTRGRGRMLVAKGSLNHVLRMYADHLPMIFDAQPHAVVEQILRDASGALDARAIKAKLRDCLIPPEAIDTTWRGIKRHLDRSENIHKTSEKPPKYRWTGSQSSPGLLNFISPSKSATAVAETRSEAVSPLEPTLDEERPTGGGDGRGQSSVHDQEEERAPSAEPQAEESDAHSVSGRLATFVRSLGAPKHVRTSQQVAHHILETASSLGNTKDRDLRPLLELGSADAPLGVALVAARPAATRLIATNKAPLDDKAAMAVLTSALDEFARADERKRRQLAAAGVALVDRLITPPQPANLPDALLIRLVRTIPLMMRGSDLRLLQRATTLLAGVVLQHDEKASGELRDWDLEALARAISALPFEPTGGRSLFVSALYQAAPDLAVDNSWWRGATFDELAEAAYGPLGSALEDPVISEKIVAPLVHQAIRQASSRKALAQLSMAPPALTRHVSGEAYRAAFERVAMTDAVAAEWVGALINAAELDAAHKRLAAAEANSAHARADAEELRAAAKQLRGENARMLDQLRQARQDSLTARDVHERQMRLELLTTLANVAISVLESPQAAEDIALRQQIEYVTSREGLTPIGEAGESVSFDPALHDAMGKHLEPGSRVTVLRAGYTYVSSQESLVLIKAQVGRG